jgi:hypothetical protein
MATVEFIDKTLKRATETLQLEGEWLFGTQDYI